MKQNEAQEGREKVMIQGCDLDRVVRELQEVFFVFEPTCDSSDVP